MSALIISALIFVVYAIASLVVPLHIKLRTKLICAVVIIAFGLKYVVYSQTGGILEPKLAPTPIVILEATYSALMLAVFFAIIKDLLLLVRTIFRLLVRVPKEKRHPWPLRRIHTLIAVVAVSCGVVGTVYQFKIPDVVEHEVAITDLAPEMEGYKILQITDLHIGPILKRDWLQGVVDRVNEQNPDLIVITGDLVDGTVSSLKDEFSPLTQLKARDGVIAVTGNHEYYSGVTSWVDTWEQMGVQFLMNESVVISRATAQSENAARAALLVSGVPDPRGSAFGSDAPNVKTAMSRITARSFVPEGASSMVVPTAADAAQASARLLLAHEPIVIEQQPDVDLVLTGHTHGGTMFFLQPLIAHFNAGYVTGMYEVTPRTHLYVSNGTGIWSGFSCRVLVPSEITAFVLTARK
ncbi:MAG: metallophosphoesterase [Candidatus Anaerobiospirillum pullicola]|uniref:Metallophosphoesterase n=1 Tax=Candidatus Anaerobiospirillum pullicola TaxID=2838451 RepID=A0A948TEV2_9GAMM|nr:metallophosphoesterase [Candidatus Anaerobiospirillum pullicola]